MNTKKLTLINDNGTERAWTAPIGGRITSSVVQGMPCATITNVVGTQVDTVCFGKPQAAASSGSGGPSSNTPPVACGCNNT